MQRSAAKLPQVERIIIIGTGLLGGSIGLALRAAGYPGRIIGVGRRMETLEQARQLGCIDEPAADLPAALRQPAGRDLVVLCTPLSAFESLLATLAGCDHPGLIITDAGSTKQVVCDAARRLLPDPSRFVGAHPMAGSELHGPQHAKADLFVNRLCILTPQGTGASDESLQVVRDFWQALGLRLTEKTPAEHDRVVAAISHLPHAMAVLLVQLADERTAISIAATGFRDTTRVASGDPRVWTDIFTTNRAAMLEAIDLFADHLQQFRRLVSDGHEADMMKLLSNVKKARDTWLKQTWGE
jgi:prephenate dehydrogenase